MAWLDAIETLMGTSLNYFLHQEIETQMKFRERAIAHNHPPLFMDSFPDNLAPPDPNP